MPGRKDDRYAAPDSSWNVPALRPQASPDKQRPPPERDTKRVTSREQDDGRRAGRLQLTEEERSALVEPLGGPAVVEHAPTEAIQSVPADELTSMDTEVLEHLRPVSAAEVGSGALSGRVEADQPAGSEALEPEEQQRLRAVVVPGVEAFVWSAVIGALLLVFGRGIVPAAGAFCVCLVLFAVRVSTKVVVGLAGVAIAAAAAVELLARMW